jgi:hypothetical protein
MAFRLSALFCCIGLTACAIHPLPEDLTRIDTFLIVGRIRCEARDAIKEATAYFLSTADPSDAYAVEAGRKLSEGSMDFSDLKLERLGENIGSIVMQYEEAAIAYDFTFDITEENDLSTQIDLAGAISRGTLSIPIKFGNDRLRQTVRNFRVADTFGELRLYTGCGQPVVMANHVYPITGTIGLNEVVKTFIDLNENQNLTGTKEKETVPVLADTFNFQTTISGSVEPKITLSPLRPRLDVQDASILGSVSRKDFHKVIVAMSLAPKTAAPPGKGSGTIRKTLGLLPGIRKPPRATRTPAERRALEELDFQIQRNILNNIVVRPN